MRLNRNILATESSPYLRQHQDNPVWWQPWSDEAFRRAKEEDKPVFLSVGYSTCYWCHVMEHDSFESQDVADLLNENFIAIKVDREELPDVDQIYMEVVIGIHGHGGWPMSVFLTPDREPIWGGTFFYRDSFLGLLKGMSETWRHNRSKVATSAGELKRFLQNKISVELDASIDVNVLGSAVEQLSKRFDRAYGGFGSAPKFPSTQPLEFLLRAHAYRPNAAALEMVSRTLLAMARGGIFDHLGGGFHRYSVDGEWRIPHFEKMVYDNALLASLYLESYQTTGSALYRTVAERTLNYLITRMRAPEGGFYSAEDAGEVEREGEFYSWTRHEVEEVLPGALGETFCRLYGVNTAGNFEHGRSVLTVATDADWVECEEEAIRRAREALLAKRDQRKPPHRDEKILAGWNGLVITALCSGFRVLNRSELLERALEAARFIEARLVLNGRLHRRYCEGVSGIPAVLEDYVYVIRGYLSLFEASGDSSWLDRACSLQREQDRFLWSGERRAYVSSAASGLIIDLCEWVDGATPSPNGVALSNLLIMGEISGDPYFTLRAQALEGGIPGEAAAIPMLYMTTLQSVLLKIAGCRSCCVVPHTESEIPPPAAFSLWSKFIPFARVVWRAQGTATPKIFEERAPRDDTTTFYVCRSTTCLEPTVDVEVAVSLCSQTKVVVGS